MFSVGFQKEIFNLIIAAVMAHLGFWMAFRETLFYDYLLIKGNGYLLFKPKLMERHRYASRYYSESISKKNALLFADFLLVIDRKILWNSLLISNQVKTKKRLLCTSVLVNVRSWKGHQSLWQSKLNYPQLLYSFFFRTLLFALSIHLEV